MQIVRDLDTNVWKEFVDQNPHGQIFHTPEMFQVFANTKGYQPTLWAALGDDRRVLAMLLPIQITLLDGLFRHFTTRAVAYGSVLTAPEPGSKQALTVLLQAYNQDVKNRILFSELRNLSDLTDIQKILNEGGFIFEDHLNFLIDLNRPLSQIWEGIRSNAKRNIQKARRSEVRIEEVYQVDEIPIVYGVLEKVYERIQVPLPDISLFRSTFEILAPKGMLKILTAKVKDTTIGALCLLMYKDVLLYWYTGTLREYSSYRCNDLLVWHSLELGHRHDYRMFDFGGGGRPNEAYGVRDFKIKFGGEQVNFGRNICVHAPRRLKLSQAGYQLMRRFL